MIIENLNKSSNNNIDQMENDFRSIGLPAFVEDKKTKKCKKVTSKVKTKQCVRDEAKLNDSSHAPYCTESDRSDDSWTKELSESKDQVTVVEPAAGLNQKIRFAHLSSSTSSTTNVPDVVELRDNNEIEKDSANSQSMCIKLQMDFEKLRDEVEHVKEENEALAKIVESLQRSIEIGHKTNDETTAEGQKTKVEYQTDINISAIGNEDQNDSALCCPETKQRYRCDDCGSFSLSRNILTYRQRGFCANKNCSSFLCRKCKNNHVLIPREPENPKNWKKAKFQRYCRNCYKAAANIDFDRKTDCFVPSDKTKATKVTIIMCHGAGGSRSSYIVHARAVADLYGHRCITIDLAGHGSRWEEECTVENCCKAMKEAFKTYGIKKTSEYTNGEKTIFLGGSWGGFVTYYCAGELSEYCSGAVFECCTNDISKKKEMIKWGLLTTFVNRLSYHDQIRFIRSRWAKQNVCYLEFIETKLGCGLFGKANPFKSLVQHNFWDWIPKIQCPCIFLNGTKDSDGYHPKTQKKILNTLQKKDQSKVVLFEGGNHLFSNEIRHIRGWVDAVGQFGNDIERGILL